MPNSLDRTNHLFAQVTPQQTWAVFPSTANLVNSPLLSIWMFSTGAIFILLVGLTIYSKLQFDKLAKKLRFEELKNREIRKKLKLALRTITKIETNPDLAHSREFNLEYLRMRMDEETFYFAIVNQVKIKVKQMISLALRPNKANQAVIGIASPSGRQVDEIFDVNYQRGKVSKQTNRVLFRIQIKLIKLPTQPSSVTVAQILDCIETFLSPAGDQDTWQPTIQNRLAKLHWDQKAKPTPLLVLEQLGEGVNVTLSTKRISTSSPANSKKKLSESYQSF